MLPRNVSGTAGFTVAALLSVTGLVPLAAADDVPPRGPQTNSGPRPCAFVREINGFSMVDDRTVLITTSPRRQFKVTFINVCRDLKWANSLALDSFPGGSCLNPGDAMIVAHGGIPDRCIVQKVEAVPPPVAPATPS